MHLAGRCSDRINLSFRKRIVVFNITECKVTYVTVFKVIDNIRALAQLNSGGVSYVRSCECSSDFTFRNVAVTGDKVQAINGTDAIVLKRDAKISSLELDFVESVGRAQRKSDRLAERDRDLGAAKSKLVRNNGVDGGRADLIAVISCGQHNIADCRRGQNAVLICTVDHVIGDARRDLCRVARGADAGYTDIDRRTGRCVFSLNVKRHVIERFGRDRRGNHKQAIGDTALGTVRGFVHDLERVLAFRLTAVGHRAAAVKMSGVDAAEIQHDLRLLHQRQADRFRILIAISRENYHFAIRSDADGLTGVFLGTVLIGRRKGDFIIVDQHFINTEGFLNVSLIGFIPISFANLNRAVLQDCKVGRFFASGHVIAIHDEHTGGLARSHVVVGCVDAGDDCSMVIFVTRCGFLVEGGNLLGQLGHTIAVVVHVLVGCEQLDSIHGRVDGRREHLDLLAILVIDSVNVLCDALCKG